MNTPLRTAALTLLAAALVITPLAAGAQGLTEIRPPQGTADANLVDAVQIILNVLLVLAALAAVVMLIVGGVRFIISQGEEDAAAKAKNTILYAIIGIIVIGLAAAVVNFVVNAVDVA